MADISILARPLLSIFQAALPTAKRLHAERQAGSSPFSNQVTADPYDRKFEQALARLGAVTEQQNEQWWRKLLTAMQAVYTQPGLFEDKDVRRWLSQEQVRKDFRQLVRAELIGQPRDQTILDRLDQAYCEGTGAARGITEIPIQTVISVLLACTYVDLSPGEAVLGGMIRDSAIANREDHAEISEKLDALIKPQENPELGKILLQELSKILRRRTLPGIDATNEISELVRKIEQGGLAGAPKRNQSEVYFWAARLHATQIDNIQRAQTYLDTYRKLGYAEPDRLALIEAWLEHSQGNTEAAIRRISPIDNADARYSLFVMLKIGKGDEAALVWLDTLRPLSNETFNAVGWRNVAIALAQAGRWSEAIARLKGLSPEMAAECPELLFVSGMLHGGLLLPVPLQEQLFDTRYIDFPRKTQEGNDAIEHRELAQQSFEKAQKALLDIDAADRAMGCDYWLMWLGLTDPKTRERYKENCKSLMEKPERAVALLELALDFDVEFDAESLQRYLNRRRIEGTLFPNEQAARLRLMERFGEPAEVLRILDTEHNDLAQIFAPETLMSMRFYALLKLQQYAEAGQLLVANASHCSEDFISRHRLILAERQGEELTQLAGLYEKTGDYDDLSDLVRYLRRRNEWNALLPHALRMLSLHRSAQNLVTVIDCLRNTQADVEEILELINAYQDLATLDTDLGQHIISVQAWLLFEIGDYQQSAELNDKLIRQRHSSSDLILEINLSLRTGRWEHFSAIVDREYGNKENLPSEILIRLAGIVADIDRDRDRAIALLDLATTKSLDNANTQLSAYMLATQIGREADAGKWLHQAMALSGSDNSPMRQFTLRQVVDMQRSRAEEQRNTERLFVTGEIPIHAIATVLNMPISKLLIGQAIFNEVESDARRRVILPIRHGGKMINPLDGVKRMAVDITSLLLLEHMELLEPLLEEMDSLLLSHRTMEALFEEQRNVRFHQPSRVEEARHIRKLIADKSLQLLDVQPANKPLIQEVGEEMASLLHAAKLRGGRVIATLPIHKAGALGEENADLGEYADLVLSPVAVLRTLENNLDPELYDSALKELEHADKRGNKDAVYSGNEPLYIDNLALHYLYLAGVFDKIAQSFKPIYVFPSVDNEAKSLQEAEQHGDEIVEILDKLRKRLRDAIENNKIQFTRRRFTSDVDEARLPLFNFVQDMLYGMENVDAYCIDDRFFGRHPIIAAENGHAVPLCGIYDVICMLAARQCLTDQERQRCLWRLRKRGFCFIPVQADELLNTLKSCLVNNGREFIENRDAKALRESVQAIRSMDYLRATDELAWLGEMATCAFHTLKALWADSDVPCVGAEKASDWLVDYVWPKPYDWSHSVALGDITHINPLVSEYLKQIVAVGTSMEDTKRKHCFSNWLDCKIVDPLVTSNDKLLQDVVNFFCDQAIDMVEEIANELE